MTPSRSHFRVIFLAYERQTFLLAHRRRGTFRETSLSGDERVETSAIRSLNFSKRPLHQQ